jgi:hypothetical protein
MLLIEVGAAAPGGYVRAVFSRKAGGFAAPLDLMRAQLGAAAKLARRRRLRSAFSDYLASDGCRDDAALRALEYISRPAFSARRSWYSGFNDDLCMSVDNDPLDVRYRCLSGGPIDAPVGLPGGGCDSLGALFGGSPQVVVLRERVEFEPAFVDRRAHHLCVRAGASFCMSGRFGALDMTGLRAGWALDALDAPVFIPAGAMRWSESCGGFEAAVLVLRAGWAL